MYIVMTGISWDKYVKAKEEVADRKADLEAGQADMEQMSQDMGRQQADLQTTLDA